MCTNFISYSVHNFLNHIHPIHIFIDKYVYTLFFFFCRNFKLIVKFLKQLKNSNLIIESYTYHEHVNDFTFLIFMSSCKSLPYIFSFHVKDNKNNIRNTRSTKIFLNLYIFFLFTLSNLSNLCSEQLQRPPSRPQYELFPF